MKDQAAGLELAQRLCAQFGLDAMQPQIDACQALLGNPDVADVALLGPFNAGKRSFLNFLLGKAVLPVDGLPVASLATRLRFGPRERALVHHLDGGRQWIPVEGLARFVTEAGNPGNAAQVALVEVETPAMERWRGLRFVDAPGVWERPAEEAEPARGPLPKVDAALVAFPMDHLWSPQVLDLLLRALGCAPVPALLLTKADRLEAAEREKVIAFLQAQLAGRMGVKVPVLPFSTHDGFGPIRKEVREHLSRLVGDHQGLFDPALDPMVETLLSGVADHLRLAAAGADAGPDTRMDLRRRIQVERIRLGAQARELQALAGQIKARARTAAEGQIRPQGPGLARRIQGAFNRDLAGRGWDLAGRPDAFRAWFAETLAPALEALSDSARQAFDPFLEGAATLADQTVRAFQGRLSREIQAVLGVPFEGARFRRGSGQLRQPEIQALQVAESHLERLGSIIAVDLLRPLTERAFLHRLPREVEANLAILAHQWADAADAAIDARAAEAIGFMAQELASLEDLLAEAPGRLPDLRQALAEIEAAR